MKILVDHITTLQPQALAHVESVNKEPCAPAHLRTFVSLSLIIHHPT